MIISCIDRPLDFSKYYKVNLLKELPNENYK